MTPKLPAVLLIDTENVFASLNWDRDAKVERRAASKVARGEWSSDEAFARRDQNLRWADELTEGFGLTNPNDILRPNTDGDEYPAAGSLLRSLVNWSGRGILAVAHSRPDVVSFGFPGNRSVRALRGTIAKRNIRHVDVAEGPDEADLALINCLAAINETYDLYILGSRDWRILDEVRSYAEAGWAKRWAFVFPPDARLDAGAKLAGDATEYGRVLNRDPGAIGRPVWGNFYEFIDTIHLRMTTVHKRGQDQPNRASGAAKTGTSAGAPWRRLSFAASNGRIPPPHHAAFGATWIAAAKVRLGSDLGRYDAVAARCLTLAWESPVAAADYARLRDETDELQAWKQWAAAALILPLINARRTAGRPAGQGASELAMAAERADRWLVPAQ